MNAVAVDQRQSRSELVLDSARVMAADRVFAQTGNEQRAPAGLLASRWEPLEDWLSLLAGQRQAGTYETALEPLDAMYAEL